MLCIKKLIHKTFKVERVQNPYFKKRRIFFNFLFYRNSKSNVYFFARKFKYLNVPFFPITASGFIRSITTIHFMITFLALQQTLSTFFTSKFFITNTRWTTRLIRFVITIIDTIALSPGWYAIPVITSEIQWRITRTILMKKKSSKWKDFCPAYIECKQNFTNFHDYFVKKIVKMKGFLHCVS